MNSFNKNFSYKKRNVDFITQNSNNDNKVSATESSSSTSSSMTAAATPALPTGSTNASNQSNLDNGTKPKAHYYDVTIGISIGIAKIPSVLKYT